MPALLMFGPVGPSVRLLGNTHASIARAFEKGKVIAFFRGLHLQLSRLWPELKEII